MTWVLAAHDVNAGIAVSFHRQQQAVPASAADSIANVTMMMTIVVASVAAVAMTAIHVAGNRVSGQAANRCTRKHASQAAMTCRAADRTTADGADDRARGVAVAAARIRLRG
jgi:hypothetical protein